MRRKNWSRDSSPSSTALGRLCRQNPRVSSSQSGIMSASASSDELPDLLHIGRHRRKTAGIFSSWIGHRPSIIKSGWLNRSIYPRPDGPEPFRFPGISLPKESVQASAHRSQVHTSNKNTSSKTSKQSDNLCYTIKASRTTHKGSTYRTTAEGSKMLSV